MNIVILDDYQDAVRKLKCASRLDAFPAKVYTNTVKGIGQLSVRLKDADVIVLIRERTAITRQLVDKLPASNSSSRPVASALTSTLLHARKGASPSPRERAHRLRQRN